METVNKNDEFEKILKKNHIHAEKHIKFADTQLPAVAVRVETALPENAVVKLLDWTLVFLTKRGAKIKMSDWAFGPSATGQSVLSFIAYMELPKSVAEDMAFDTNSGVTEPDIACSFYDFCWYQGHEVNDDGRDHRPETETEIADGVAYGDIGWYMPGRFADRLIEALGKAQDVFLSGVLEDAVLYGLIAKGRNS